MQPRIKVEAEAVLAILALVEKGEATLISSDALTFEVDRTDEPKRRADVKAFLSLAGECITLGDDVVELAKSFEAKGLKGLDALHVASATHAGVDFFATCDDRLLKKASLLAGISCKMISVLKLAVELTK
jgi:predicted nucleic acid-binding protein